MRAKGNSREMWVATTRESVLTALDRERVPMSASALHGNLPCDTWTSLGPLTRTTREISAALNYLVEQGWASVVPESERTEWDPSGKLYVITQEGWEQAS